MSIIIGGCDLDWVTAVASRVGYWMDAIVLPHIVVAKQWPLVELNDRVIIVFSRTTNCS